MPNTYYRRFLTREERFWSFVQKGKSPNACWLWQGTIDSDGYGRFAIGSRRDKTRRQMPAHRFSYELFNPPIPNGFVTDHTCLTRNCVNPSHLCLVTQSENVYSGNSLWAINKRKVYCKRGHPLSDDNLYIFHRGTRIERHCRTCRRLWMANFRS